MAIKFYDTIDPQAGINLTLSDIPDLSSVYAVAGHTHNYDNYGSWNLKTNSVQRIAVTSGGTLNIVEGTGIGVAYSAGGTVTISATGANANYYLDGITLDEARSIATFSVNGTTDQTLDLTPLYNNVETVYEVVHNASGAPLLKGTPLAVLPGQTSGNVSDVAPADASDPTLMPAVYILNENLDPGAEGKAVVYGRISGIDTSAFDSGTTVYVAPGGGWTAAKPTGDNLIQNLGIITKSHGSNGGGVVMGAGRSNDVPNIAQGHTWVGNANSVAVPTQLGTLAFSSATYDNYQSWNLKTNGVQRTTVQSGGTLDIVGGTNTAVAYSAGGVVTVSSTDTNNYLTGLSFNTSNGILTATRLGLADLTVDLDGRYNAVIGTDADINTGGYTVIDQLTMTDGVITAHSTRSISQLYFADTRSVNDAPNHFDQELSLDFKQNAAIGNSLGNTYSGVMTIAPWRDPSGGWSHQLLFSSSGATEAESYIGWRVGNPDEADPAQWSTIRKLATQEWVGSQSYLTSYTETSTLENVRSRGNSISGAINFLPDTGDILQVDGGAILTRNTFNGALTFGKDDMIIMAAGDTKPVLNANLNESVEQFVVGAEGGAIFYAFPNNNTAWTNRQEFLMSNDGNFYVGGNKTWTAGDFTTTNVSNWNTAHGWGDHSTAGYALSGHIHSAADITSGTLDGARLPWNDNDGFNGTYPIVWTATNELYRSSWLQVRGSDDTLLTRNISATGSITLTGAIGLAQAVNIDHGAGDGDAAGTVIETFDTSVFIGAFLDFTIYNDPKDSMRSGTLQLVFNPAEVMFNEVNTMDIGDTTPCTLVAVNNGGSVDVIFTTPDPSFHIKYHVRTL